MFSTDAGRKMLSSSAGFEWLVVVALSREHEYRDMEAIKTELSSKVMELAPSTYRKGVQVMSRRGIEVEAECDALTRKMCDFHHWVNVLFCGVL